MRLCLNCGFVKHTRQPYKCSNCETTMKQVSGRMRSVAETLTRVGLDFIFAICDTYTTEDKCTAEIIVGFSKEYDKLLFSNLPKGLKYYLGYRRFPKRYMATQVLKFGGIPYSIIVFEYSRPLDEQENVKAKLKEVIKELQDWATELNGSGEWSVCKLRGDF